MGWIKCKYACNYSECARLYHSVKLLILSTNYTLETYFPFQIFPMPTYLPLKDEAFLEPSLKTTTWARSNKQTPAFERTGRTVACTEQRPDLTVLSFYNFHQKLIDIHQRFLMTTHAVGIQRHPRSCIAHLLVSGHIATMMFDGVFPI